MMVRSLVQELRLRTVTSSLFALKYTLIVASVRPKAFLLSDTLGTVWQRTLDNLFGYSPHDGALALAPAGMIPRAIPAVEDASTSWNGILLAAPKKKVSHSRKAMRAANKGLKDRISMWTIRLILTFRLCTLPCLSAS